MMDQILMQSYTASYIKTIARQLLRIKSLEFTNLLEIYTLGVARSQKAPRPIALLNDSFENRRFLKGCVTLNANFR